MKGLGDRAAAERHVSRGAGKQASSAGARFRQDAQEFYSYSRGRQSSRGAFALRFDARPHRLSLQVDWQEEGIMKERASVKKICDKCKGIHRRGEDAVSCTNQKPSQG